MYLTNLSPGDNLGERVTFSGEKQNLYDLIRSKGPLLSLLDLVEMMQSFDLKAITRISYFLGDFGRDSKFGYHLSEVIDIDIALSSLENFGKECDKFGFDTTYHNANLAIKTAKRFMERSKVLHAFLQASPMPDKTTANDAEMAAWLGEHDKIESALKNDKNILRSQLDEINKSFAIQADSLKVLYIERGKTAFWIDPESGWEDVIKQWPDTAYDIVEAGKCLALDRPTAAVFHLARIGERGLRDACKKYLPPAYLPLAGFETMGAYFRGIDDYAKPAPQPLGAVKLSEAAELFRPIKNIWRDDVMHCNAKYTEEEARVCYYAIQNMLKESIKIL